MGNSKPATKILTIFLVWALILSNGSLVLGADMSSTNTSSYNLLAGTDFENSELWGFVPGGGATSALGVEGDGNKYLLTTGAGSGTRSIVKTLDAPTGDAVVLFTFDWKPEEVSTASNSSEILFSDTSNNSLFRLVKAGGPGGEIKYSVGTTGTDLSQAPTVTGVTYDGSWLSGQLLFNFTTETVSLKIHDKLDATRSFEVSDLDLSHMNYVNSIAAMTIKGNRASGNTLNFRAGLDNVHIYGSGTPAPNQSAVNIQSIVTPYQAQYTFSKGLTKEGIIANFPVNLDVLLENNVTIQGAAVQWDSLDYNPNQLGDYTFTGVLDTTSISNVANGNHIKANVTVTVTEAAAVPQVQGYENAYYSDFGDTVAAVPVNWGFTTTAATLAINNEDIGGNTTPKLLFNMANQSGGRVATKEFESTVKGNQILLRFDWYPGKVNDKNTSASENGGELRIMDSSNNIVFTLNHTNNAPLTYFAGGKTDTALATGFMNAETWFAVDINLDLSSEQITLKLTDQAANSSETYTSSLANVNFDGSVAAIKFVGVRTAGNNITWTTYMDNFGIYYVNIPANTITKVDKIPYHRVYVNETTTAMDSIGLPEAVTVTLANNSKANVAITEWIALEKAWNPAVSGVYPFKGILAATDGIANSLQKTAAIYVYNRLQPTNLARQTQWLDRGVIALQSESGIFVSWRLLADEYAQNVLFHIYRNGQKINSTPLSVTNYVDPQGTPGDIYKVEAIAHGDSANYRTTTASVTNYISIPMQKPEGGTTATGDYTYSVNDAGVGDLDGDGEYEVVVKWYPSNSIDSSQTGMTGPTIFDAYKWDGTLLWRMNMGLNLTSGAHYHPFIIEDFNGDGKSDFMIKTADATTVYGANQGVFDSSKVISVIGNPEDNGKWVNESGHVYGGPEYISVFDGATGKVLDTIDYAFPLGDVASWGDTWHNRSDRFLSGLAFLDGVTPSAIFGRGYYERTTFVAYKMLHGKLHQEWTFDSAQEGKGGGLGYHSLSTADVDNDGFDEIIAGSLTLDQDGKILYMMDGEMGREQGSHGDALHVGAFDPNKEGIDVIAVHEVPAVASVEYHDGATGETLMSYYAYKDTGRGLAANITSEPGYEFWGTGGPDAATGGGIYNVQGSVYSNSSRDTGLPVNFALYWDGDLLHELLDDTTISKFNEHTGQTEVLRQFEGVVSSNGTKATPTLQADILGDWREEVLLPTTDSLELRVFSTTIPTEYRLYTLMQDPVYRNGIAWQNSAYNQPPHLGFYLGEDIKDRVLAGGLNTPKVAYTNKPREEVPGSDEPTQGGNSGGTIVPGAPAIEIITRADGSVSFKEAGKLNEETQRMEVVVGSATFEKAVNQATADPNGSKNIRLEVVGEASAFGIRLPLEAVKATDGIHQLTISSSLGDFVLPYNMLANEQLTEDDVIDFHFAALTPENEEDKKVIQVSLKVNGVERNWNNPNASVKVAIPYQPSEDGITNHELLSVIYIDHQGNRTPVYNGRYNPNSGTVDFTTNHFSHYAVSYVEKTFADLTEYQWAQKAIEVLASKGIITGTSDVQPTFEPGTPISRADFILLLVKTLGLHAEADANFQDIHPEHYYYEAVGIARALGITNGQGSDLFNPNAEISRQDMMVLTSRALQVAGHQLDSSDAALLSSFADKESIADYAQQAVANLVEHQLIVGHDNRIDPLGHATRAETAVFLYRIYNR